MYLCYYKGLQTFEEIVSTEKITQPVETGDDNYSVENHQDDQEVVHGFPDETSDCTIEQATAEDHEKVQVQEHEEDQTVETIDPKADVDKEEEQAELPKLNQISQEQADVSGSDQETQEKPAEVPELDQGTQEQLEEEIPGSVSEMLSNAIEDDPEEVSEGQDQLMTQPSPFEPIKVNKINSMNTTLQAIEKFVKSNPDKFKAVPKQLKLEEL